MVVKALTPKERKKVFTELGFTLTNMPEDRFEEVMWFVLELAMPDTEFTSFKEETDTFNKIIAMTYEVSEEDTKN